MRKAFIIELLGEDGVWRSEGEHYATLHATREAAETDLVRLRVEGFFDIGGGVAFAPEETRIVELKAPSKMDRWLVRDGEVFLGIISAPDDDSAMEIAIAMGVTAGIEYSETLTWERLS